MILRFDPDEMPELWSIQAIGHDVRELLNSDGWRQRGSPRVDEVDWVLSESPRKLLVRWGDSEAFLPFNVEDGNQLPPPSRLEQMSAEDMLLVLAAADPSAAFRYWSRSQEPSDDFDSDLDSASPIDLDALRRYDLQTTFLHRIRRRARILARLRASIEQPIWGKQSLEWKLNGLIGVGAVAERLRREYESADGGGDEALLMLADFLIVLDEVCYEPIEGSLPKTEFDGIYRPFLNGLAEKLKRDVALRTTNLVGRRDAVLDWSSGSMPKLTDIYDPPEELVLGTRLNARLPEADQKRQREEVVGILSRLRTQPGVILADEVGMGKTFVALGIAYSVAVRSPRGPAIVMVPPNLVEKWVQDLKTFCELYLESRHPLLVDGATRKELTDPAAVRFGVARHSIDLMKLLDDPPSRRCHLIFLAQGAMGRLQTDKWVRLALIAEALRRHGRGGASRLILVKKQIHRFLAELIKAVGEQSASDWGENLWGELLRSSVDSWKDIYNGAVKDQNRRLADDPVPKAVTRMLKSLDLNPLATALELMPLKATGGAARITERVTAVRAVLREIENKLWSQVLAQARWRSPLLVMDEAHHLKNPASLLARQLQSTESTEDLRTGDGALANAFDRMLFLTATPFQLGHHELVNVLTRFGGVAWNEG
ncbi:MAG: hypothetical protein IPF82_16845 [Blastocatellia bacterium]|nr:hypothetical protein [Blastocatellia bacterium]